VWKHTLAALFPPSPETPLQNQEVKSSAFLNQEQEPQPFTHKPSDSLRKQKKPLPLKPADRFGMGITRFLACFTDKESSPLSALTASPSQTEIVYQQGVLNRLSGYSDACHFTMPAQIYPLALPNPASSKGGSLPHAFH